MMGPLRRLCLRILATQAVDARHGHRWPGRPFDCGKGAPDRRRLVTLHATLVRVHVTAWGPAQTCPSTLVNWRW